MQYIHIRTGMPNFSDLEYVNVDWSKICTGAKDKTKNLIPHNLPPMRWILVRQFTYHDANLCPNKLNDKTVTLVLHFINQPPYLTGSANVTHLQPGSMYAHS